MPHYKAPAREARFIINEVLRIEEAMGGDAVYAGASAFAAPIREHLA